VSLGEIAKKPRAITVRGFFAFQIIRQQDTANRSLTKQATAP